MLTVVHEDGQPNDTSSAAGGSLLDEIVRDGARRMLAAALQAEVAAYITAHTARWMKLVAGWWSATVITRPGR